jgi:hypothetical protein
MNQKERVSHESFCVIGGPTQDAQRARPISAPASAIVSPPFGRCEAAADSPRRRAAGNRRTRRGRPRDLGFRGGVSHLADNHVLGVIAHTQRSRRAGLRKSASGSRSGVPASAQTVLLIFLLKAGRPEVYRDHHRVEHTGTGRGGLDAEARLHGRRSLGCSGSAPRPASRRNVSEPW